MIICNTDGALADFRSPIIKRLVGLGNKVYTLSGNGGRFNEILALGAEPLESPFNRHSVGLKQNISLFFDIFRKIKTYKPDVVHSYTHKAAVFGSIAASLLRVPKIFVTITGLGTVFVRNDLKSKLIRALLIAQYKVALTLAETTYFQNPDDRDLFVRKRIVPIRKTKVTPGSGLDIKYFDKSLILDPEDCRSNLEKEIGVPLGNKKIVLFPGRAVKEKGIFEYYKAAKKVYFLDPERFVFVHIGSTDPESSGSISLDELNSLAKNCNVHYLGYKKNPWEYMQASDIICLPSYREGVPRSLIEALALGKWIITTDAPGCREVILNGKTGLLCEPGSSSSLSESIFATTDANIDRAINYSRRYCEEKFDVQILIAEIIHAYGLSENKAREDV